MSMMLLRIKSNFQVFKLPHYPNSFVFSSSKFDSSQEDNDQAFPVTL